MWADAWYRFKKNKLAVVGLTFVVILVCVSIGTIILDLATDNKVYEALVVKQNLSQKLDGPSLKHFFGCDEFGRDILFRLLWGTRYSLFIGVVSILSALIAGGLLGAVAGYYGGITDNIIMRILDIYQSIPGMLLAIALAASLGPGVNNAIFAVGISTIPVYSRIIRASIMTVRDKEYIEAATAINASDFRIITRHVLPNSFAPLIVEITMNIGNSILMAATLSFIGLGAQPPSPEWGAMLSDGRNFMRDYGYLVIYPGICIMASVLSFNMLGDGLRDALDPRLKN